MKTINTYINEKLQLTNKRTYTCQPNDKYELREIIIQRIKVEGQDCDLNDIDVSKITDMSYLFDAGDNEIFKDFNGDVSLWDVSNVENMRLMFNRCHKFDCDISMWDVSNVKNMRCMFNKCYEFDCDISKWDVSNVEIMYNMFKDCKKFKQNLNGWDVSNVQDMYYAFYNCPTKPEWYDKDTWE
jgi:surface protein